jgi:hypothetical protein
MPEWQEIICRDGPAVWRSAYRPEGATQYRALYGDLHAADVSEDKLPEKP